MSNTDQDHVILVDTADNEIRTCEKLVAHQEGLLHRAFSIFVLKQDVHGQWMTLLQQRHEKKYHCGGLWSNTCCSHPRPGESTDDAVKRRLEEEMGLKMQCEHAGHFIYRTECGNGLIEHEYDHVYIAIITGDIDILPNPAEVQAYRWEYIDKLQNATHERLSLTPWFTQALEVACNNVI